MTTPAQTFGSPAVPVLLVRTADGRALRFSQPFHIGRGEDCEVRIEDVHVSRKHLALSFDNSRWRFRDLQSSNGVFVNGQRVETASIEASLAIWLGGVDGPVVTLEVEPAASPRKLSRPPARTVRQSPGETRLLASYAERYFGSIPAEEQMGARTMMIRKAFQNVQRKQQRKFVSILAAVALAALALGGYAYYGHQQLRHQQAVAEELFYAMKSLDVEIADTEQRLVVTSGQPPGQDQVRGYLERRRQMEENYDTFLSGLQLYDRKLTEQERLILRVTRIFGECELAAPPEYLSEVNTYIHKWQSSGRFARATNLAQTMGYTRKIAEELLAQNLPPQFFYLAMEESDFEPFRIGPPTRMGFAKGMWQFIPDTGTKYGLAIGPLVGIPRQDPDDDRLKWEKATRAAARYIKDIYATDAQASGLLVMASYNWGEHRIINLLRSMPANPRERNFWKVLEKHRDQVPKETYDYVLYIVSAAVIGENPRLFGFPFDSPLASIGRR
jgi:membrane-bound lytic murein transglycosylase D